jgi:hypothetical protein
MVDDKLRILEAMKKVWGRKLTTVWPRQGHYATDPNTLAKYAPADITLPRIASLLDYEREALRRTANDRWGREFIASDKDHSPEGRSFMPGPSLLLMIEVKGWGDKGFQSWDKRRDRYAVLFLVGFSGSHRVGCVCRAKFNRSVRDYEVSLLAIWNLPDPRHSRIHWIGDAVRPLSVDSERHPGIISDKEFKEGDWGPRKGDEPSNGVDPTKTTLRSF